MNSKFFSLFLFVIFSFFQNGQTLDESYFNRSIFNRIRDELGSFSSKINITLDGNETIYVKENYSFKLRIGEIFNSDESYNGEIIYIDDLEEIYELNFNSRACGFINRKKEKYAIPFLLSQWVNIELSSIKVPEEQIVIGPNYLLWLIMDFYKTNKEAIKCEDHHSNKNQKRCELQVNESYKIEYFFETKGEFTMYPINILTWIKLHENDDWEVDRKFEYLEFEANFVDELVNHNLPIGYGCERKRIANYPRLSINFESEFKLDFDVHLDVIDEFGNRKIRNYSNSMIDLDNDYQLNINELINSSIRTYYDKETGVVYKNNLNDDNNRCERIIRKVKSNKNINWFDIQELFINHKEFFYAYPSSKQFSYLGEYKILNNQSTYVYESVFNNDQNDQQINYIIVSHYYPINKNYFEYNPFNRSVPIRIDFNFYSNETEKSKIGNLTININEFEPFKFDRTPFDMSKCISNSLDYNLIQIKFNGEKNQIQKFKKEELERNFRMRFYFTSPFRVGEIKAETNENSIYVNFTYYEQLDAEESFNQTNGLTFSEEISKDTFVYEKIKLDKCIRMCVRIKDCGSYAYDISSTTCRLWIKKGFDESLKNNGKYDWSKLKTIKYENSKLGRRLLRFTFGKHCSNKELIDLFKQFIKEKIFSLVLKDNENEIQQFYANDLIVLK